MQAPLDKACKSDFPPNVLDSRNSVIRNYCTILLFKIKNWYASMFVFKSRIGSGTRAFARSPKWRDPMYFRIHSNKKGKKNETSKTIPSSQQTATTIIVLSSVDLFYCDRNITIINHRSVHTSSLFVSEEGLVGQRKQLFETKMLREWSLIGLQLLSTERGFSAICDRAGAYHYSFPLETKSSVVLL